MAEAIFFLELHVGIWKGAGKEGENEENEDAREEVNKEEVEEKEEEEKKQFQCLLTDET